MDLFGNIKFKNLLILYFLVYLYPHYYHENLYLNSLYFIRLYIIYIIYNLMKYLKLFEEINIKSHNWYVKSMIQNLEKLGLKSSYNNGFVPTNNYKFSKIYYFKYDNLSEKNIMLINKTLNTWKPKLLKSDIIFSFEVVNSHDVGDSEDPNEFELRIRLKEFSYRVKPPKFVYHYSPISNRKSIEKYGLLTKSSVNSLDNNSIELAYPEAVFAKTDNNPWGAYSPDEMFDKWEIDTSKINNQWYIDPNMEHKSYIFTLNSIPPEAIKLFRKGNKK
jgi:hypothetical protein